MGTKLITLGIVLALVFAHYLDVLFAVGAMICAIGLVLMFLDR